MTRTHKDDFTPLTIAKRYAFANGKCEAEGCGFIVRRGDMHADHHIPVGMGGKPTFENCRILCVPCHFKKTGEDMPPMRKADRQSKAYAGIKRQTVAIANRGFAKAAPKDRTPGPKEAQLRKLRRG